MSPNPSATLDTAGKQNLEWEQINRAAQRYNMEAFNIRVIEAMEIPEQYEADFLRDIADKLGLQFPHDSIFTERLAKDNLESDWLGIAKSLNPNVTEEEERLKLAENTRKTWSKEICNTLKQSGFTYEPNTKKLWLSAR
ncbi:MAG: hypothetical protein ACP5D7_22305, partial [Limnospira sp.]